ncbi:type II secretion system minor pseudopilin GspJ [Sphingorhabdus arenilitoris]|uniref:Type II secretion system protein J n=1 Tax=Sphingorhabdus arenilitoris TaxID=1490041 RepID=A0ABV8RKL4_9SPHN
MTRCSFIKPTNGFTLVELLVALFIFSLISVAGLALLRSSADGQVAIKNRLAQHSDMMRTANLLEADLAQAISRQVRDNSGNNRAAFVHGADAGPIGSGGAEALFAFTRTGLPAAAGGSAIGRVAYSFVNGAFRRTAWSAPDGGTALEPAVLLDDLQSVTVRYRDNGGQWRSDWSASDTAALPRAVELTITPKLRPAYRIVLLVGTQVRPAPQIPGAAGAAR